MSEKKKHRTLLSLLAFVDLYLLLFYQRKGARFKFRLNAANVGDVRYVETKGK